MASGRPVIRNRNNDRVLCFPDHRALCTTVEIAIGKDIRGRTHGCA